MQSKHEILFSIIVPVYNVEKFLSQCVESLVGQSYKNIEIILVDDGSTDESKNICDEWTKRDSRIIVCHKKNEGLGMARNTGMQKANGDYICFVDSDDYIDEKLMEDLYTAVRLYNSDLYAYGYEKVSFEGKVLSQYIPVSDFDYFEGQDVMEKFLPDLLCENPKAKQGNKGVLMSACCMAFSKKLIEKSNFQFVSERNIISEDVYSLMKLMPNVNCVKMLHKSYYKYRMNSQSLTHSYKRDRFEKINYCQKEMIKLCSNGLYNEEILYRINRPYLDNVFACMKMEVEFRKENGFGKSYRNLKKICHDDMVANSVKVIPYISYTKSRQIVHFLLRKKCPLLVYFLLGLKDTIK